MGPADSAIAMLMSLLYQAVRYSYVQGMETLHYGAAPILDPPLPMNQDAASFALWATRLHTTFITS